MKKQLRFVTVCKYNFLDTISADYNSKEKSLNQIFQFTGCPVAITPKGKTS